jgi:hypothetical protein
MLKPIYQRYGDGVASIGLYYKDEHIWCSLCDFYILPGAIGNHLQNKTHEERVLYWYNFRMIDYIRKQRPPSMEGQSYDERNLLIQSKPLPRAT